MFLSRCNKMLQLGASFDLAIDMSDTTDLALSWPKHPTCISMFFFKECSDTANEKRLQQCAKYNKKTFQSQRMHWIAYHNGMLIYTGKS